MYIGVISVLCNVLIATYELPIIVVITINVYLSVYQRIPDVYFTVYINSPLSLEVASTAEPPAPASKPPAAAEAAPRRTSSSEASAVHQRFLAGLATKDPSTVLSSFFETRVQVNRHVLAIKTGVVQVLHRVQAPLLLTVDDKTKPARREFVAVQPHDDFVDGATFGEQLVDLFFRGEVGELTDVDGPQRNRCRQIVEVLASHCLADKVLQRPVLAGGAVAKPLLECVHGDGISVCDQHRPTPSKARGARPFE